MRRYVPFDVCTWQALEFALESRGLSLDPEGRQSLSRQYRALPAFAEVPDALSSLRAAGHRLYAFSNGTTDDLEELLDRAGIESSLDGIVSVHDVESFKPDPGVYEHFAETVGSRADDTWLVSGNPFDVIGAAACDWRTIWVRRDPNAVFDTWDVTPTRVVADLGEIIAPD